MADKTTTLKTKTNDNVYPNIIGDNRDNAISDSPQIKHTLTANHKINFRLDTNVNNLINNSLQKPAGLTKTKLVGVGANGQENIEIGDNLTLANGKLSASGGGGSKVGTIELTNEQINGYQNNSFTLTDEQLNIIKNNDYIIINSTIAISETETSNISELYNKTYLSQTFNGQVYAFYGLINYFGENIKILTVQDKNAIIATFKKIDSYVQNISIYNGNFNITNYSDTSNTEYYYMMYINHKPVISKEQVSIDLPDAKTISLFGNHSILVPKDSEDANINLYRHNIVISGTTGSILFMTVYSSNNLKCKSFQDIDTLFGSTNERTISCSGIVRGSTSSNGIYLTIIGYKWSISSRGGTVYLSDNTTKPVYDLGLTTVTDTVEPV